MATSTPFLEPLSTGDIIDRSVGIYRRNSRALLATVSVPFLVGVAGWLLVQFGQNAMFGADPDKPQFALIAILASVAGFFLSAVAYPFLMVLAVAGLSRAVGDYIMLGEPITARGAVAAVRQRLGQLTIGSLFLFAYAILIMIVFFVLLFVAILLVSFVMVGLAAMDFPPVVAGVISFALVLLIGAAFFLFVVPYVLSFVLFIPQSIMIEGSPATTALSRAMKLGRSCWKSILGILVFTYCSGFSITAAIFLPILLAVWLTGHLTFDVETFNAINGGVSQFSSFLVVPVWSIAYTLLYFDSRVRKEGYDVDLLVRQLPVAPAARTVPAWHTARPAGPFASQPGPAIFPPAAQPFGRPAVPNRYEPAEPPSFTQPLPAGSRFADGPMPQPSEPTGQSPYLGMARTPPVPFGTPAPKPKFAPDGRCLRCGRFNMFNSPNCPSCGW